MKSFRRRRALLRSSALAGVLVMSVASVALAQYLPVYHFNIPAESLSQALKDFSVASSQQIVFSQQDIGTRKAPPLQGSYTRDQALAILLSGTDLHMETSPSGVLMVQSKNVEAVSDEGAALPESAGLETVVVTANKREQSTTNVADSVNVLGSKQLDQVDALKMSDYIGFLPGLQMIPGANNGQQTVIIRGIAPQLTSPTTATYIDDIPVGAVSGQGAGAQLALDIDPSELQRVEVLNGPQGTIYGSSSLGGVVKYDTRLPDLEEMTGRVSVDGFDIDHGDAGAEARAAVSVPIISDELAISVSGHYRDDPGYLDDLGDNTKNANWGKDEGARFALYFTPSSDWEVKLSAMFDQIDQNSDNSVPIDEVTRQPTYGRYDQLHPDHAMAGTYQRFSLYSATITHTFGDGTTLTSATGYSDVFTHLMVDASTTFIQQILAGARLIPVDDGVEGTVPYSTTHFTQEVRLTSSDDGQFRWMAGLFYQHETDTPSEDYFVLNPDGSVYTPPPALGAIINDHDHDSLREFAGFGNASYYLQPNLWFTLGYRYSSIKQDYAETEFGYFLNPADPLAVSSSASSVDNSSNSYLATLSWKPTDNVEVYGRAASGYRPGGNQSTPPGAPADFKTTYNSDSIWNYEVGLKGSWLDNRLSGTLAAYWIDWSDIQQELLISTFFYTGNGGQARSRGFEASVEAIPIDGLSLNGTLSYTDATFLQDNVASGIVAGEAIPNVSKWTGAIAAEYTTPISSRWNAFVGGDIQFRTANETIDGFKQDGYQTVGLHAGVGDDSLRLSIYAKNLLNQYRYISAQSSVGSVPFYTTILQLRTIGISVSKYF